MKREERVNEETVLREQEVSDTQLETVDAVTRAYRADLEKSREPITFEQAQQYGQSNGSLQTILADPFDQTVPVEQRMNNWPQIFELMRACKIWVHCCFV